MGTSVSKIPSVNIPLTDERGRITPVWHEFLRSFIAKTVESTGTGANATVTQVGAGSGLIDGTDDNGDPTLNVGAGTGLAVNANDVAIDIVNLNQATPTLDDDMVISDRSNNNTVSRTSVRDIVALANTAPGGNDTEVQYNDNGFFNADSGFTYDGAGGVTISDTIAIGDITIDGISAVDTIYFDGTSSATQAHVQSDGNGGYLLYSQASGSHQANMHVYGNNPRIDFTIGATDTITMQNIQTGGNGIRISGQLPLCRTMHENVTASTTQTQGNGALTGDYCNVTTVANVDDTVTLPVALRSRYCLVRNAGANRLQIFPASGDNLGAGVNNPTTLEAGEIIHWFSIDATTWAPMGPLHRHSVTAGITASTTQTQGQQPLKSMINEVSTVANANDTVTLPTAKVLGQVITIINNGANTLQIFPASGDNLGAGVDTSTTLATSTTVRYLNYDTTNWVTV